MDDPALCTGVVIAFAVVVGGCSTDVTRFDFPFFGLTDKGGETGSLPLPPSRLPGAIPDTMTPHPARRAAPD